MTERPTDHPGADPGGGPAKARVRDLLAYLGPHRRVLGAVVVLSVLGAGLALAQPLAINRVITSVEHGRAFGAIVWVLVLLVVGAGLLGAVQQFLLERTAEGVVLGARKALLGNLLTLPVREYERRRTGDLVSRVGSDTTMLRAALTGGLVDALAGSLIIIGSVVAMAVIDLSLLLVTVGIIAVALVSVLLASGRIQALTQASQAAVGRVAAGVERVLSGIRTVRAAGATDRERERLEREVEEAFDIGVRIARLGAVLGPISGLAVQGAFLAVLGIGGYRVADGTLSVADLVTFIIFLFMLLVPLGQSFSAVITVRSALGALARVQEIIGLTPEGDTTPGVLPSTGQRSGPPGQGASLGHGTTPPVPATPDGGPPSLTFADVTFSHRPGEPVLCGVSFEVPQGSTTAVVGASGAGKSTLLALVERFYDLDGGAIRLDGTDLVDLPRSVVRSRLGYVEQEAPVLAGTIRDNLLLASPDADDERCRRTLGAVNLLERVLSHPDGLDAVVGDDGVGLSGGERQRLAIARALIGQAPVLLLDEPTSSLDGRNELAMRAAIASAAQGRTVVIVAHRLATVVDADQIVVLDEGRVAGRGTHRELLETNELYRELASHQLLV